MAKSKMYWGIDETAPKPSITPSTTEWTAGPVTVKIDAVDTGVGLINSGAYLPLQNIHHTVVMSIILILINKLHLQKMDRQ